MKNIINIIVKEEENGSRIDSFVSKKEKKLSRTRIKNLILQKNLKNAAKNLYKTLRMIKKKKFKSIAIEKIPNKGFGEAINDRLLRASKL